MLGHAGGQEGYTLIKDRIGDSFGPSRPHPHDAAMQDVS